MPKSEGAGRRRLPSPARWQLVPDRRSLDGEAGSAPGRVDLERHQLVGEGRRELGPGVSDAATEAVVQRDHVGLLQAIGRNAVHVALAEVIGTDVPAVVLLMEGRAGGIELARSAERRGGQEWGR